MSSTRRRSFYTNKDETMRALLDDIGTQYKIRAGWQPIRCPNGDAHSHGDKNPSASLHLSAGLLSCMACGLKGDAFDIAQELWGLGPAATLSRLGRAPGTSVEESEWLI